MGNGNILWEILVQEPRKFTERQVFSKEQAISTRGSPSEQNACQWIHAGNRKILSDSAVRPTRPVHSESFRSNWDPQELEWYRLEQNDPAALVD